MQIALYLVTTIYMVYIARKSRGGDRIRYFSVGTTCFVMDLFLILQIFDYRYPSYATGLIIGICVIHSFVESRERKEKEIYDSIARGLAEDYEAIYYINVETGKYREFSKSPEYDSLQVPFAGKNFYDETRINIDKYVHPDDREFAHNLYCKETMLKNLENRKSYSYKYKLIINGQPRHFQFTMMRSKDQKHFVLYEKDIDDEITFENMRLENHKKQVSFTEIAEILAVKYDVIYYVDAETSDYISYECRNIYGNLQIQRSGADFFADSKNDIINIVHKNDHDLVLGFLNKDHIITALMNQKSCSLDYRVVAFKKTYYVRMTVQKTANGSHYIIGIENIDNGMDYLPFGLIICDTNELKKINDSQGHQAGDEYIKKSAKLLCDIFVHSPVFRVGGDEFVVFLRSEDYTNRENLMKILQSKVQENLQSKSGPILASGMSEYIPESDCLVSEIFNRADKAMYKNKRELKKAENNQRV